MKNNKLGAIALALGLTFGVASVATAGNHHGGKHGGMESCSMGDMHKGGMKGGMMGGKMFSQLDLTTEQQVKIKEIMSNAHTGENIKMTNMKAEMHGVMSADKFDEKAIRDMIARHHETMIDNKVSMFKARHQAFKVLTTEQQEKLQVLTTEHMGKVGKNHKGMKGM